MAMLFHSIENLCPSLRGFRDIPVFINIGFAKLQQNSRKNYFVSGHNALSTDKSAELRYINMPVFAFFTFAVPNVVNPVRS